MAKQYIVLIELLFILVVRGIQEICLWVFPAELFFLRQESTYFRCATVDSKNPNFETTKGKRLTQ